MDERNRLNDEKRTIAGDTDRALQDLFTRVFRWQVTTRGCSPRAALEETQIEVNRLLDAIKDDVLDSLVEEYLARKKG